MEYPVEMLLKEQLSDYSVSQLQQQHLPVSSVIVMTKLTCISYVELRPLSGIS